MSSTMHWNLQQKLPALLQAHLTDKQSQVSKLLLLPSYLSHYSCNDEKPTCVDALFLMHVTVLNGTVSDPLAYNAYKMP